MILQEKTFVEPVVPKSPSLPKLPKKSSQRLFCVFVVPLVRFEQTTY